MALPRRLSIRALLLVLGGVAVALGAVFLVLGGDDEGEPLPPSRGSSAGYAAPSSPFLATLESVIAQHEVQVPRLAPGAPTEPLPEDLEPTVIVARDFIYLDGDRVVPLTGDEAGIDPKFMRYGPDDLEIGPLSLALGGRCAQQMLKADARKPCTMRLLADERTPEAIVSDVLFTAAINDYVRIYIVVRMPDGRLAAMPSSPPRPPPRAMRGRDGGARDAALVVEAGGRDAR